MKKVLFKKWIPRKIEKESVVPWTGCYEKEFINKGEFLACGIDYVDDG